MIRHAFFLILFLLAVEFLVLYVSGHKRFEKYFRFLPPVFWIYFLPMLAATSGLIDTGAAIYGTVSRAVLPASLVLLLMSSDIRAVLCLGKTALIVMLAGSAGIMIGIPLAFGLTERWIGSGMWSGFGALSGSWIGGSSNMIAVKEAIGTPDKVFTPMVVVDTIVPYSWMAVLIAASSLQKVYDHWIGADRSVLEDLGSRVAGRDEEKKGKFSWGGVAGIFGIAAAGAYLSQKAAVFLPEIKNVLSGYSWTIIVASLLGIGLSLTRLRSNLEYSGASKIGYVLLYFVLTTIGARANLSEIHALPALIMTGFIAVGIHIFVLIIVSKLIRAPMFLVAAASQANIGGVASAPVVAAIYQPGLASVGLLLAVLGNVMGTYLGIITAQFCRVIAQ